MLGKRAFLAALCATLAGASGSYGQNPMPRPDVGGDLPVLLETNTAEPAPATKGEPAPVTKGEPPSTTKGAPVPVSKGEPPTATKALPPVDAKEPIPAPKLKSAPLPISEPAAIPMDSVFSQKRTANGNRIWVTGEYLMWWVKNGPTNVPLVTTAPDASAANMNPGNLGDPSTAVVFNGPLQYSNHFASGARLSLGGWFDCEGRIGLEASGFFLGHRTFSRQFTSDPGSGSPLLALPFNDMVNGTPSAFQVAAPVAVVPATGTAGSVAISSSTSLWGFDVNVPIGIIRNEKKSVDLLIGYRHANLQEELSIATSQTNLTPVAMGGAGYFFLGAPAGDGTLTTFDSFQTRNRFNGAQIGIHEIRPFGKFSAEMNLKVALGSTQNEVNVNGNSGFAPAGGSPMSAPGGVYSQFSNMGRFTQNHFSVIPEAEVKVNYCVTNRVSVFAGYNFLYWSQVVRPGNQIDPNIDIRQVPSNPAFTGTPGVAPHVPMATSEFWAQGINVGVCFKW
jgi:hypothetical protein